MGPIRRIKSILFVTLILICLPSFALEGFHDTFQVVRDAEGRLVSVKVKNYSPRKNIRRYMESLKGWILEEQFQMEQKGDDYFSNIDHLFAEEIADKDGRMSEWLERLKESLRALSAVQIEKLYSNPQFNEVLNKFEGKLGELLAISDPSMLARPNDSQYFLKKKGTHEAVKMGLKLAQKVFGQIPILNTISFIMVRTEEMISDSRNFYHNYLLHYLENAKEEELGLSHDEINLIYSSIFESRVSLIEHLIFNKQIKATWPKYGVERFFGQARGLLARKRQFRGEFDQYTDRLNFGFLKGMYQGEPVIINLIGKEHLFNSRPAISYYEQSPNKVLRKRQVLELASLGISFLTVPDFIKSFGQKFFKSFYEEQRLQEGALMGYLKQNNMDEISHNVRRQALNPFVFIH